MAVSRPRRSKFSLDSDRLDDFARRQADALPTLTSQEKDDDTRQDVARKFVRYYFGILIGIVILIPVYNLAAYALFRDASLLLPFKDGILTYSAVVGPTFGLVVAYYFKTSRDD